MVLCVVVCVLTVCGLSDGLSAVPHKKQLDPEVHMNIVSPQFNVSLSVLL